MATSGLVLAVVGCLCLTGCCCAGCVVAQQKGQAARAAGPAAPPGQQSNPFTSCCSSNPAQSTKIPQNQLQAMQQAAMVQQDRADRLESYILRQRQMAYE